MKKLFILTLIISLLCPSFAFADELSQAKTIAVSELDGIFALYDEYDYEESNWNLLIEAYNNGKTDIINAATESDVFDALNETAENMISVRHEYELITACISVENLVLQKGFLIFPEFVKVPKYQPLSKTVNKLLEAKNPKVRNPLLYTGDIDNNFEITSVYLGLATNATDETEVKVPNYLTSYVGRYLQEPINKTYLNSGDYTDESCFVYSVNNKFPNVKASAIPVVDEDVIRIQFSVYGKGADVGANSYTSSQPIITPADKTELFTIIAETVSQNDMELLLSNEVNKDKFYDVLVVAEIVNISQTAVDRAIKKLLSLEPVTAPEEIPDEEQTPETPDDNTASVVFTDLEDGHFAKEAIDYLSKSKILNGRPDGTFGINDNITRGEFATILARYENSSLSFDTPFEDVKADDWFAEGVAFCYKTGITTGKTETRFEPDLPITRQELATMIYRYINYKGISIETENKPNFIDNNTIAEYARKAVDFLKAAGIISGRENNTFSPLDTATRSETAKIFYNVIK